MSSDCSRTAIAVLCAAGMLASTSEAWSLIVYEGRVVQSWPDQPDPGPDGGLAYRQLGQGSYYSAPKGEVWGLTILVEFSDEPTAFTVDEIDAWLNQLDYSDGGLNGSIRDYFLSNSNGMLDYRNEIVGFYQAEQPKSYYQGGNGYERAGELVAEVIEHFDPTVDFSRFDNDGDGSTEAISIAYAGDGGTFAQGIWPHSGSLRENRDGVRLNRYMMTALEGSLGIYVFAHESGHMIFGWPDLYGFGDYCVMGNATNSRNPAGINDFYRADQGWIPTAVIEPTTNAVYAAQPNAGGYLYLNPADDSEAFFWSNIRNVDRWEVLRGSGLLMFHFDYRIRTNDPPNPLGLAVVQADGLDELGVTTWPSPGSDANDFFHAGTADELSDETSPSTHWNDGSASGLRIYDISESAETMTFTVGTGTPEDLTPIYFGDNSAGASSTGGAGNSGAGGTQTASGGSGDAGSAATGGNSPTGGGGASTEGTGGASAPTGGTTASGGDTTATGGNPSAVGGATTPTGGVPAAGGQTTPATGATCAAGLTPCGSSCADLSSDVFHCGDCGVRCLTAQICNNGICTSGTAPVETPTQPVDGTEASGTQESGCSCDAAGAGSSSRGALLGLLVGLSGLARRRRPR